MRCLKRSCQTEKTKDTLLIGIATATGGWVGALGKPRPPICYINHIYFLSPQRIFLDDNRPCFYAILAPDLNVVKTFFRTEDTVMFRNFVERAC